MLALLQRAVPVARLARGTAVVSAVREMNPSLVQPQDLVNPVGIDLHASDLGTLLQHLVGIPPSVHSHEACQSLGSDRCVALFHL